MICPGWKNVCGLAMDDGGGHNLSGARLLLSAGALGMTCRVDGSQTMIEEAEGRRRPPLQDSL